MAFAEEERLSPQLIFTEENFIKNKKQGGKRFNLLLGERMEGEVRNEPEDSGSAALGLFYPLFDFLADISLMKRLREILEAQFLF